MLINVLLSYCITARKSNLIKVHFKKHVQITFKTQLLELLFKITLETLLFVYATTAG